MRRDLHTLLELFKYITENPEPSKQLLENLRVNMPTKPQVMQRLVFLDFIVKTIPANSSVMT